MAMLDAVLGMINVAFFYAILIWILVDSLRQSKNNGIAYFKQGPMVFATITVVFNAVISAMNMAFTFHEYRTRRIIGYNSVSLTLTWVLSTIVSFYSMKRTLKENHRFPLVLILWWVFTSITDALLVCIEIVKNFESLNLWFFLSEDNIVGMVSLPMLLLLVCFNTLPSVCAREQQYSDSNMEQRLLQGELESSMAEDEEAFTNASMWSQLTFQWLNPIFSKGRVQKLELGHIPSVPHSETAENASSMLEESLRKQKLEGGSLTKAITHSIWKSLVSNAVFAGNFYSFLLFKIKHQKIRHLQHLINNVQNRYSWRVFFFFF